MADAAASEGLTPPPLDLAVAGGVDGGGARGRGGELLRGGYRDGMPGERDGGACAGGRPGEDLAALLMARLAAARDH